MKSIIAKLDKVANDLELAGHKDLASSVDIVSNTLEPLSAIDAAGKKGENPFAKAEPLKADDIEGVKKALVKSAQETRKLIGQLVATLGAGKDVEKGMLPMILKGLETKIDELQEALGTDTKDKSASAADKEAPEKLLIVMRGVPGSGKSTKAKELQAKGGGQIFSTDDYPGLYSNDPDGKVNFHGMEGPEGEPPMIAKAHAWNQERADKAMAAGVSPVIIDNTNVKMYEAKPYYLMAQRHGYAVAIEQPETPWKFDLQELGKRNSHGASLDTIERMLTSWDPQDQWNHENVLNSKAPWENA